VLAAAESGVAAVAMAVSVVAVEETAAGEITNSRNDRPASKSGQAKLSRAYLATTRFIVSVLADPACKPAISG
jgi:hypothetical protein